jgi:hypothetical protein
MARIPKESIRVLIVTPWNQIEGAHYVVPGVRVSDSVNSDVAARARYLPLTDAVVRHGTTGEVVFRSRFLMVAHAHIVCMTPTTEIEATAKVAGLKLSEQQLETLTSDMVSLLSR